MNEHAVTSQPATPIPDDNPQRHCKIARPNTDENHYLSTARGLSIWAA